MRPGEILMETIKVGIREFRAGLAEYIGGNKTVAVTRHGQTVGYFIPTPTNVAVHMAALRKAGEEMNRLLTEAGIDPEEIVAEFDALRKARSRSKPSS